MAYNLNIFTILFSLWIAFWLVIFYIIIFQKEVKNFIGLLFCYILIFPLFSRIYLFGIQDKLPLQYIWFSILILSILFLILVFYLIKLFVKTKENKFITQFNNIYSNALKQVYYFLVYVLDMQLYLMHTMQFLTNKLNSEKKILWFFLITNYLPRTIFFSSLLWDININQELYYSLKLSILIIIPLIVTLCLRFLEVFSNASMDAIHEAVFIVYTTYKESITDSPFDLKALNINEDEIYFIEMELKLPRNIEITDEWFENVPNLFECYTLWVAWCKVNKEIVEKINIKLTIFFIIVQIFCQINSIIQQCY